MCASQLNHAIVDRRSRGRGQVEDPALRILTRTLPSLVGTGYQDYGNGPAIAGEYQASPEPLTSHTCRSPIRRSTDGVLPTHPPLSLTELRTLPPDLQRLKQARTLPVVVVHRRQDMMSIPVRANQLPSKRAARLSRQSSLRLGPAPVIDMSDTIRPSASNNSPPSSSSSVSNRAGVVPRRRTESGVTAESSSDGEDAWKYESIAAEDVGSGGEDSSSNRLQGQVRFDLEDDRCRCGYTPTVRQEYGGLGPVAGIIPYGVGYGSGVFGAARNLHYW